MRNIILLGGSSHPELVKSIAHRLGIPVSECKLSKFSNQETNVEVAQSVRDMDVYIIQSGCGQVNDNIMELLIMVRNAKECIMTRDFRMQDSVCEVIAVIPCFPYSRQRSTSLASDRNSSSIDSALMPYSLSSSTSSTIPLNEIITKHDNTNHLIKDMESYLSADINALSIDGNNLHEVENLMLTIPSLPKTSFHTFSVADNDHQNNPPPPASKLPPKSPITRLEYKGTGRKLSTFSTSQTDMVVRDLVPTKSHAPNVDLNKNSHKAPYKSWCAKPGTLIAEMLEAAGADQIITMDLHDPQFQGYFNIPVDNLYSQPLILKYIKERIADYKNAVIVSPDAGGAKRATVIADKLSIDFALIHKDRRNSTTGTNVMLVGEVKNRTCILIDDLADTSNTLTRAAELLKKSGALKIFAIITHGVMSGDAIHKLRDSVIDEVIVGNTVPQEEHVKECEKIKIFDVAPLFSEAIRRIHNGESVSFLFNVVPL